MARPRPSTRRAVALCFRQPADQDGDEDDVVDAEDDLQHGQRDQGQPGLRVGHPFHHRLAPETRIARAHCSKACASPGAGPERSRGAARGRPRRQELAGRVPPKERPPDIADRGPGRPRRGGRLTALGSRARGPPPRRPLVRAGRRAADAGVGAHVQLVPHLLGALVAIQQRADEHRQEARAGSRSGRGCAARTAASPGPPARWSRRRAPRSSPCRGGLRLLAPPRCACLDLLLRRRRRSPRRGRRSSFAMRSSAGLDDPLLRRLDLQRDRSCSGETSTRPIAASVPTTRPATTPPVLQLLPVQRQQHDRQVGRGGHGERQRHQVRHVLALGEDADRDGHDADDQRADARRPHLLLRRWRCRP